MCKSNNWNLKSWTRNIWFIFSLSSLGTQLSFLQTVSFIANNRSAAVGANKPHLTAPVGQINTIANFCRINIFVGQLQSWEVFIFIFYTSSHNSSTLAADQQHHYCWLWKLCQKLSWEKLFFEIFWCYCEERMEIKYCELWGPVKPECGQLVSQCSPPLGLSHCLELRCQATSQHTQSSDK